MLEGRCTTFMWPCCDNPCQFDRCTTWICTSVMTNTSFHFRWPMRKTLKLVFLEIYFVCVPAELCLWVSLFLTVVYCEVSKSPNKAASAVLVIAQKIAVAFEFAAANIKTVTLKLFKIQHKSTVNLCFKLQRYIWHTCIQNINIHSVLVKCSYSWT